MGRSIMHTIMTCIIIVGPRRKSRPGRMRSEVSGRDVVAGRHGVESRHRDTADPAPWIDRDLASGRCLDDSPALIDIRLFGDLADDPAGVAGREDLLGDVSRDHAPGPD